MAEIVVEHLKYRYPLGVKNALDDVSFRINKGEFIGIIGENLSGKSTLCQALVGLVPHFFKGKYSGKVEVSGLNIRESTVSQLSEMIGLVFQNPFTQVSGAKLTVYEEIAFGLENLGLERTEIIRRVESVLHLLDIYAYKDQNPFELSGGQMQRMAIASIVAMKPEVIILDEPTSQLDPQGAEEVFASVQKLSEQGMTVLMVEHNVEKIAQYADRVMLLHQGKLIDFDTPEKIFSRDTLSEYGVVAPAYTRFAKALYLKEEATGLYPVTAKDVRQLVVKTCQK